MQRLQGETGTPQISARNLGFQGVRARCSSAENQFGSSLGRLILSAPINVQHHEALRRIPRSSSLGRGTYSERLVKHQPSDP